MEKVRGPTRLTAKQEKFVLALVEGKSQREAYKEAYDCKRMKDTTIDVKACELFAMDNISVRYNELMDIHRQKALITREDLLLGLKKVFMAGCGLSTEEEYQEAMSEVTDSEGFVTVNKKKTIFKTKRINYKSIASIAAEIAKLEGFYTKEDNNVTATVIFKGEDELED